MTDVPSNLIPTRISQLPVAPVADENSQMMIIYQGNNYRIRVGDLLSVAGVPVTRQVIAGTGMAGGGQLSANVTLSIAPGGVGSTELAASGVTPGVYGTSTDIPVFTVDATGRVMAATTIPATITGYVPDTRQVIAGTGLTGGGALSSNVTLAAALSNATPLIGDNAGAAGVSTEMARADHQHPAVDLSDQAQINGILPMDQGGTARSLVPDNGGIVWSGADGLYIGPVGGVGQVMLAQGANEYIWVDQDALDVGQADNLNGGDANKIPYQTATDVTDFIDAPISADTFLKWDGADFVWAGIAGAGTVTSVGLSMPAGFSVSGSPVTASGTLTAAWASQTANLFLASPNGSPGTPTFRAIAAADVPTLNQNTTGSAGSVANAATFNNSGSGAASGTTFDGSVARTISYNTVGAPKADGTGASGTWGISISGTAATATNVAGGAANKIVYNTNSSTTSFIDAPTVTDRFLKWNGSAFVWDVAGSGTVTSIDVSGGTTGLTTSGGPVTTSGTITIAGTLAVANGGTGATDAGTARTNLGAAASGANSDITSMSGVTGGISSPDFIQFDATVSPLPTDATAKLYYNNDDQFSTLAFQMNGGVIHKIGEELYYRAKCSSAVTKGQVVMFTGTLGSSGGLTVAPATGLTALQSNYLLGIAAETGNTNDWIFVTSFGEVKNLNTTGGVESWVQGQELYYNPAVTGGLTKTKPSTPNAIAQMAAVVHVGSSNGILFVRPTYGSVLGGTDGNVQFGTLNNGDVVVYDGTDMRWENVAQSALAVGTATNLAGGAASNIVYQSGAGATAFLANGAAGQVLLSNGASAPSWAGIDGGTF
jgi:hypothetical protein